MSLESDEAKADAVAIAPRVTLADIERKIAWRVFGRGTDFLSTKEGVDPVLLQALDLLTVCIVVTESGFTITETSACASPENFDKDLGEHLAYEKCIREMWKLEGYLLKHSLTTLNTEIV